MVMTNNLVKMDKTKPQIIFEPLGKLVTPFTYGIKDVSTIRDPFSKPYYHAA